MTSIPSRGSRNTSSRFMLQKPVLKLRQLSSLQNLRFALVLARALIRRAVKRAGPSKKVWCSRLRSTETRRFYLLTLELWFLKKFHEAPFYVNQQLFWCIICSEAIAKGEFFWVYLGVKTCEVFLCFVAIVRVRPITLTSLFSLFYVTGECHRFLHRGWAVFLGWKQDFKFRAVNE